MSKLIFKPVSIVAGLLSGLIGKKLFDVIWRLDGQGGASARRAAAHQRPQAGARAADRGCLFRAVKGLVDHGSREGFARVTGSWPGEQEPQSASSSTSEGS